MRKSLAIAVALLALPEARAAGFLLNEQNAAATGRADAVVARPADASAIFWNPAGLAALPGFSAYVGVSAIAPEASYAPQDGGSATAASTATAVVPSLYTSMRVHDLLTVGLGVNSPFGLAITWPASSPGRQIIREQALRTFFISPAAAVDLDEYVPGLLAGAGVDLVPAQVYLTRDVVFGDAIGTAELGGRAFGLGFRGGLSYAPPFAPGLTLGVAYRSGVTLDFEGDADFEAEAAYRNALPEDGEVKTSIDLPQSVLGGVAYALPIGLTLELDVNWIDWSVYDTLVVHLPDGSQLESPKSWEDTLVVRAGGEYALGELRLRGGYAYDPTPVPATTLDFTLPDVDRHVVTLGAGYELGAGMHVDLAGLYVLPKRRDTSAEPNEPRFKGSYEVSAFVVTLGVGYTFGADAL